MEAIFALVMTAIKELTPIVLDAVHNRTITVEQAKQRARIVVDKLVDDVFGLRARREADDRAAIDEALAALAAKLPPQ